MKITHSEKALLLEALYKDKSEWDYYEAPGKNVDRKNLISRIEKMESHAPKT